MCSEFESRTNCDGIVFLACKKQVLSIILSFYYSIYLGLTSSYSLISAKVITGNSTSFSRFSLKSPLTASKQYNH